MSSQQGPPPSSQQQQQQSQQQQGSQTQQSQAAPPQQQQQQQQQGAGLQRYVVIHVATTCDEHGVYVTKDSAETIELGWIVLDSSNLEELHRDSVLIKPGNTPITPLCTSLTTLTWEHVRNAGSFRDAINKFDSFAQEHLISRNLEFAFVTLDAWDLRVQLPREARDKAVVLPPYLQHSRTFDLRTEYQKWQAHHPESLPFGSSALANICAALEVEPVQSSAPIKHNLPFHLQALAPASPRRAMEESITLARVLRGLIRKSQPPSEHPDILTRPLDARADVRAFLSERSKVLHMSGLPHDTTQSELESWFTQFGGRPIAFWTLKTPDAHKPTGTGFAIFSSHEEAAESLCMNGRALNEKAIEVSPSSHRVLDRAQDILSPFPPSKNRPRPGDWNCPSCGFSNFQRRTACFRCSYPAEQPQPMYGGYGYGHPGMMPPHPGHHMQHGGHGPRHGGHGHGNGNEYGGGGGGGGRGSGPHSRVPFRAGDWTCGVEGCLYHNFAKNVSCLRCGAPRATAAITPGDIGHGVDGPGGYGMAPPSMGGTPGPGHYGGGPGFHPSAPGFSQQGYGGPPSNYALPSGLGANASPYPPMGGGYGHNGGGMQSGGGFDSRAEAAFSSAGGHGSFSNRGGNPYGGSENGPDPFNFLSTGLGNLSMGDSGDARRNGNSNKSPA